MAEKSLLEWARDSSPFLTLANGESVDCEYLGYDIVANRFDVDKETVRYTVCINKKNKTFEKSSGSFAKDMAKIKEGTMIRLTRFGEGNQTKYTVAEITTNGTTGVEENISPEEYESANDALANEGRN